jgi:predicted permease
MAEFQGKRVVTRLRVFLSQLRGLVRGRRQDQDIRDQLHAHLEEATEEYLRQGLSPADARRAARIELGNVSGIEEACRDASGRWHHDLGKDLGYGARMLRRNPGFSTVAILSLAVGIAANSAIFTIVNSMLLRPRPIASPEEIVELYTGERERPYETTSYPSYLEFRDRNGVFTGLAAYSIRQFTLGDANHVEQIWGEPVSGNYFDVLGVPLQHGRAFLADEDVVPGRNPVVVLSHGLWRRRFNSDPNLVGQAVTINGQQLTVIGIAPPQYTGAFRGLASEAWVPINMMAALEPATANARLTRLSRWLTLVGRLQPGVTIEQARARFDVLSGEMQANYPKEWRSTEAPGYVRELFVSVLPERDTRLHPGMVSAAYAIAALLSIVINLVLAVACINLANMLLARSVARRKEFAVRLALGAGRFRLIRQLLAESVLLSLLAGALGIVLAAWWLELLLAFMPTLPEGIRLAIDLRLDWRAVAYTIGFSTATGILFGLAPAIQSSRTELSTVLKDESGGFGGDRRKSRIRAALVVAQVAFSLFLLIGAGLMLRSLDKVRPTRLGFSSDSVLVASLTLDEARYDRSRTQEFYRHLSERLSALPGVHAVSMVEGMPGGFMSRSRRSTEIEGYEPGPGESLELDAVVVGAHYFRNMQIPILQGRDFDERDRDGAPCVAIVNEAFARRFFSTSSPLGKRLTKADERCEIVGLVRDNRWQSLNKDLRPFYWLALGQSNPTRISVLVHTAGDPSGQTIEVRRAVHALDPHLPVNDVQTLNEYFGAAAYPFQVLGVVLGGSGVMALLLATIGIYGVVSYTVAQRTREVGIRIALGALRGDILKMIVGQGMRLVTLGLAVGLLLSAALTRVLTSSLFETELLFGVSATDSLTFWGVTLLLVLVALVACCIPAIRATTVDPVEALRYE